MTQQLDKRQRSQSVQRATTVLKCLALADQPLTATQIADELSLNRTVVRRLLETLADDELVERDSGRYALGCAALGFGQAYLERMRLRLLALPYLLALQNSLLQGEPRVLALTVISRANLLVVERLSSVNAPLDVLDIRLTGRAPLLVPGRAMLAYESAETLALWLGDHQSRQLEPRLAEIRSRNGVEFSTEPFRSPAPGIEAVGVAIRARDGRALAGLSISGADIRHQLDVDSPVCIQLRRTAEAISAAMGTNGLRASATTRRFA